MHAELNSYFGGQQAKDPLAPVIRGMTLVVDAVVIAFIQAHRIPDEYSNDGAWQLLVDLSFLEWVLDAYASQSCRQALRDVVTTANLSATSAGGKPRREQVSKGTTKIVDQTRKATEGIWAGIRCVLG